MWEQKTDLNKNDTYTWQAPMENFISGLNAASFAGYNDWRLPTIKELNSIADLSKFNPVIDMGYFPNTISSDYWSSTHSTPTYARFVHFGGGYDNANSKSNSMYVRAVRGGQNQISGHLIIKSPRQRQASVWNVNSTMPITWDTAGIGGNVKISLSYEGGKTNTFQTIIASTPNDGYYEWTIPNNPSFNCMLKIEPLSDPSKGTVQGLFSIGSYIRISPPDLVLTEPAKPDTGAAETFSIMLAEEPSGDVILNLYSSNPGEISVSPASVTLNSANWNTGATVTVTPEYDGITDGDQRCSVLASTASSTGGFSAHELSVIQITVRNADRGTAVDSVSPSFGTSLADLPIIISGSGFTGITSVSIFPDSGSEFSITPVSVGETVISLTVPGQPAGNYNLKIGSYTLPNALTFSDTTLNSKKAIIVAGSGPYFDNSLWNATEKCTNKAYQTLAFQGYSAENIRFLSRRLWADVTGNGENDIDGDATKANFEYAIKTWAANNTDELLIYMTGPGGEGSFQFGSNAAPVNLTAATLDSWLDTLQNAVPDCKIIVIYDACQSGSFLSPLAGENRILITSTTADERAWFLDDGEFSFSYRLFDALFNNADLIESFKTAKENTGSVQTSLLDWNGDGIPDTLSGKRSDPETLVIGRGRTEDTAPPEILNASANPEILVSQTSSVLSASGITAANGLSRVWARIIPPAEKYISPDAPVIVLPTIKLLKQGEGVTYQNTYENFTQQGFYNVFVYAKDLRDFQSLPKLLTVKQTNGEKAVPGDMNADGDVTLADALLILKLMIGKNMTPAPGSDIDGDDKTEPENAVFILQRVAGMR